eukprot:403364554
MGICSSKKSVSTKDPADFTVIQASNQTNLGAVANAAGENGQSRFEKVKIHVHSQMADPQAVVDEDIESEKDEEDVVDDANFEQQSDMQRFGGDASQYMKGNEKDQYVVMDGDEEDEDEYYEEEEYEDNGANYVDDQSSQFPMDNEEAIRQIIQQLTHPNFNLIEQQIQQQQNHDLYATQTTIILNPSQFRSPTDLQKDYEKIPNRLHVPDQLANENNPNITVPSQPTTTLGLVGLYNLGNTCFINTAIQCLSACQPLTDYFNSNLHYEEINEVNPMGYKGEVSRAFGKLVKLMWRDNSHTKIYPIRFCKVIEKWASHFANGSQQDTQEFISYLLDCLHEDLNRAYQRPAPPLVLINQQNLNVSFQAGNTNSFIKGANTAAVQNQVNQEPQVNKLSILPRRNARIPEPSNDGDKMVLAPKQKQDEEEAMESWKNYLQKNKSVIVDLFQGQLKSTLSCLVCGHKSTKFDCLMYLSVPISAQRDPNTPISLQDCLQDFSKQETLDNQNKWYCEQCKKHQPATKKIDIWKLPSILIICLKRFKFLGRNKYLKINEQVSFPMNNLDLSPYISSPQREKPIYDLFSVANHEGTMTQGHYYAYTWNHASRNWYYFNDHEIKLIKNLQKIQSPEAYILFYSKTSIENFLRQTLRIPDYWPHMVAVAAKTLSSVKGNDKRSKIQRHRIKQNLQSLKSSLSSFAQSGGFLTAKQQSDFMIHLQSQTLMSINRSTLGGGFNNGLQNKRRVRRVKKKNGLIGDQFQNNTMQNSLEPKKNFFINQSMPSISNGQNTNNQSSQPISQVNINNINIRNEVFNQVNHIYNSNDAQEFHVSPDVGKSKKKRIIKVTKKKNHNQNMVIMDDSNPNSFQNTFNPNNEDNHFLNQKPQNPNQQSQILMDLDLIAQDSSALKNKEHFYTPSMQNIGIIPPPNGNGDDKDLQNNITLENESILDTFNSLNHTANFGLNTKAQIGPKLQNQQHRINSTSSYQDANTIMTWNNMQQVNSGLAQQQINQQISSGSYQVNPNNSPGLKGQQLQSPNIHTASMNHLNTQQMNNNQQLNPSNTNVNSGQNTMMNNSFGKI